MKYYQRYITLETSAVPKSEREYSLKIKITHANKILVNLIAEEISDVLSKLGRCTVSLGNEIINKSYGESKVKGFIEE